MFIRKGIFNKPSSCFPYESVLTSFGITEHSSTFMWTVTDLAFSMFSSNILSDIG